MSVWTLKPNVYTYVAIVSWLATEILVLVRGCAKEKRPCGATHWVQWDHRQTSWIYCHEVNADERLQKNNIGQYYKTNTKYGKITKCKVLYYSVQNRWKILVCKDMNARMERRCFFWKPSHTNISYPVDLHYTVPRTTNPKKVNCVQSLARYFDEEARAYMEPERKHTRRRDQWGFRLLKMAIASDYDEWRWCWNSKLLHIIPCKNRYALFCCVSE